MADTPKPRLLIVDDLVGLRRSLSQTLREYDILLAADFEQAMSIIENQVFDVALIDIRLEFENVWNVDGLYLLEKIKERHPDCGVIIFTGHRDSIREETLQRYDKVEIIEKDEKVNVKLLRDAVKKYLVGRS